MHPYHFMLNSFIKGNLSIDEMYTLFNKYHINITKQQLEKFYMIADTNKDNALDWNEFINTTMNEQANSLFAKIIREIR